MIISRRMITDEVISACLFASIHDIRYPSFLHFQGGFARRPVKL